PVARASSPATPESSGEQAAVACAALAIAWAICHTSATVADESRTRRLDWLRLVYGALAPANPALTSADRDSVLVLRHETPDGTTVIDLPVTLAPNALARIRTGSLQHVSSSQDAVSPSKKDDARTSDDAGLVSLATITVAQGTCS